MPKDNAVKYRPAKEYKKGVMHQLGLQGEGAKIYPLWEQLTREVIIHMKSREFREELLQLVRNDDIHIRLFALHLHLLNERLKSPQGHSATLSLAPSILTSPTAFYDFKSSQLVLNSHRFPKAFQYHLYSSFHSHLPEELFFDDFMTALGKACAQTYKGVGKALEKGDAMDEA